MKSAILNLSKRVLVVEFPNKARDFKVFNDERPYLSYFVGVETKRLYLPVGEWRVLGMYTELKDGDVVDLVRKMRYSFSENYLDYIPYIYSPNDFDSPLKSFQSAIESEIFWENPYPIPSSDDINWYRSEYTKDILCVRYIAVSNWKEAQGRTFDKERTLIFKEV